MTKNYLTFTIDYFQDEDGIFTALVPDIKGCVASGNTLEKTYENVKIAIDSCLEARKLLKMSIESGKKYDNINQYHVNA